MSTAKFDNWLNSDGTTNYKCRAWVNFNGTGTVAIRASGNVSSITDNGVGQYRVNFTTAMPDANYSAVGGGNGRSGSLAVDANTCVAVGNNNISYVDYQLSEGSTPQDSDLNFIAIFR